MKLNDIEQRPQASATDTLLKDTDDLIMAIGSYLHEHMDYISEDAAAGTAAAFRNLKAFREQLKRMQ